jgi:hypothetical protein
VSTTECHHSSIRGDTTSKELVSHQLIWKADSTVTIWCRLPSMAATERQAGTTAGRGALGCREHCGRKSGSVYCRAWWEGTVGKTRTVITCFPIDDRSSTNHDFRRCCNSLSRERGQLLYVSSLPGRHVYLGSACLCSLVSICGAFVSNCWRR